MNLRALSYDQLHELFAPNGICECSVCDQYRLLDEWETWAWEQGYREKVYAMLAGRRGRRHQLGGV